MKKNTGINSPTLTLPQPGSRERKFLACPDVSEIHCRAEADDGLPDHIREFWIRLFGRRVERSMQLYEESGCFGHRGEADGWRLKMEALINGRSKAQVLSLEIARGLAT